METKQELEAFFEKRAVLGVKPGLERILFMLERLGHPEKRLKAVHVAGTNGKGSTIQFIEAALVQNNYRVGVFTSPSFTGIGGHLLMNGEACSDDTMMEMVQQLLPYIEALDQKGDGPTSFEIITVLAFLYFKDKVDIALIETGMGGRFDTTNCFVPDVAVITNIALDHMAFLGKATEDIAWHKAGIIKQNRPVVVGRVDQASEHVIKKIATEMDAPLYTFGQDFCYEKNRAGFTFHTAFTSGKHAMSMAMKGQHQADNAAIAFMALALLKKQGLIMDDEKIVEGMAASQLPGRFEEILQAPRIILDSAHNVAGMKAFLATLQETYPNERKVLVFAGFQDKQLEEMLHLANGRFDDIICTTFAHERAADINDFRQFSTIDRFRFTDHWQKEVKQMCMEEEENTTVYAITGSLHFITLVRQYILSDCIVK